MKHLELVAVACYLAGLMVSFDVSKLPQTLGQTFQTVALVDQAIDCDMCFNLLASG